MRLSVAWLLRVVWGGVKRAGGGVTSVRYDTPAERNYEGGRASCRVLFDCVSMCMYVL